MAANKLLLLLLAFCIILVKSWPDDDTIAESFRTFLGADGNTAANFLQNGNAWYQIPIQLGRGHARTTYYIPLFVKCKRVSSPMGTHHEWDFKIPDNADVKNAARKTDHELTELYNGANFQSHVKVTHKKASRGQNWIFNGYIAGVYGNDYYDGKQIMKIFMTLLVRGGTNFAEIRMDDLSRKECPKGGDVDQSLFKAMIGRNDFYREYGFYAAKHDPNNRGQYIPDGDQQALWDAAVTDVGRLTVKQVMDAADALAKAKRQSKDAEDLAKALLQIYHPLGEDPSAATMKDYLKQYLDDWDNKCDEFIKAINGLKALPTIKTNYLDKLKPRGRALVWNPNEGDALDRRLAATAKTQLYNKYGTIGDGYHHNEKYDDFDEVNDFDQVNDVIYSNKLNKMSDSLFMFNIFVFDAVFAVLFCVIGCLCASGMFAWFVCIFMAQKHIDNGDSDDSLC